MTLLALIVIAVVGISTLTLYRIPDQTSAPAATHSTPQLATPSAKAPSARPTPARTSAPPKPSVRSSSTPPLAIPKRGPRTFVRATSADTNLPPRGKVIRFGVEVEKGVPIDPNQAAKFIHQTFNDPRSWGGKNHSITWIFVPSGKVDVTGYLSTPDTVDHYCITGGSGNTHGELSCRSGDRINLNAVRWAQAVPWYNGDITAYRQYMVNHEFGHFLGKTHLGCPGKGQVAPVMLQQTKFLNGCKPNPWPADDPPSAPPAR